MACSNSKFGRNATGRYYAMGHTLPHGSSLRENGNGPSSWTLFDLGWVADTGHRSVRGTRAHELRADSRVAGQPSAAAVVCGGEVGDLHPLGTVLRAGLGTVVASRARLYQRGLHQEQPVRGVVPERPAHSGLGDAGLSQRTLRGGFQLLRLCSHLQPRVEEVESRRVGKDFPRRWGALCGADDEAPRGLHAMAECDGESESFDSAEREARGA